MLSLCSSSSKAERTKVEHGFQRYEACIRDIPTHTLHLRTFEVSILPSWVVEEWNGRESDHFYSSCQVAWGFFNKFSKQTLLSSSFDSLRSLNEYMSLPRHLTCLFFILLLAMAICGAQDRVWRITHTCITRIAKSKTGSKETNKSYN